MKLPDKLNRKAVKANFVRLGDATWDYLFDHEKDNGLLKCRTKGWGRKHAWYSTKNIKKWLIDRGYYMPDDLDESLSRPARNGNPWAGLQVSRHTINA